MAKLSEHSGSGQIIAYLKELEKRISRLESHLNIEAPKKQKIDVQEVVSESVNQTSDRAESLEFHIGEFWFAKVGIVILAIGIAFLLTFPYQNLPSILPAFFGYILTAAIFIFSHYWRKSFSLISRYLLGGGLILLYFTTLRLYFFSDQPVITNLTFEIILLSLIVIINLTVSAKRESVYLTSLSLTMGYVTALISDQSYVIFFILVLMSILTVYFKLKFQWHRLIIYGILLTFFAHFLWFLNNPFLGNELELVTSPQSNLIFILIYILIFASGNYLRNSDLPEDNIVIASTFLICFGGYGLYLLLTIIRFQESQALFHLLASILFLGSSIAFWVKEKSKFSTFFYAMFGYAALSVAIIAEFKSPNFFVWLSWQSIIVISTAIWFRSKFIIVANFLIYAILFFAYIVMSGTISLTSLSFGLVALISARIMNWQKDRLELKTESMRNAYLASAFFIFPYALYHIVPSGYVSLSWIGVTLFYFVLSIILNNKKYRWMAILTLLLTVTYILIIGIVKLEPALRIASLLILGIALLAISIIYTRIRARSTSQEMNKRESKTEKSGD